ncbi:NYN domain-containing protein [uncultured Propionivibrio sp.]|uniref:NYN domain-containing protein n=1 Tax=uncultured Propionivibrio sp. TaxID=426737 RepID=UPI0029C01411|nr:NYN domain-containing protein [uncultured Propionivibrio sp.]
MAASPETVSMAMFCDFENVALGVRDAKLEKFEIKPVLERLLLKGSIVVKKAYCDWDRYKPFKAGMHEANFELIEIPHVRQSGKNSADIRMVVDALDLCYTKSHVNTFVIVSGDSDFSPLVSKLRENAKYVIGVGVRQSTSDLLIANCDEFIFYDDLVREHQRKAARRDPKAVQSAPRRSPEELDARRSEAVELAVETLDALVAERGDSGKIWASMLKEALKRRKPDFAESAFGFRSFGNLLEEAQSRGLIELGRDEKSGAFVSRSALPVGRADVTSHVPEAAGVVPEAVAAASSVAVDAVAETSVPPASEADVKPRGPAKRRGRGKRATVEEAPVVTTAPAVVASVPEQPVDAPAVVAEAAPLAAAPDAKPKAAPRNRRPRKPKTAAAKGEGGAIS